MVSVPKTNNASSRSLFLLPIDIMGCAKLPGPSQVKGETRLTRRDENLALEWSQVTRHGEYAQWPTVSAL